MAIFKEIMYLQLKYNYVQHSASRGAGSARATRNMGVQQLAITTDNPGFEKLSMVLEYMLFSFHVFFVC